MSEKNLLTFSSEGKFLKVANQLIAGIAQTDLNGRFVLVNDFYCELVGFSREELLGKTLLEITHPDDVARNVELFQKCVEEGAAFTIEKRYVRKDGSAVWVRNNVSLLRDAGGAAQFVIAVSNDISGEHEALAKLEKSDERYRAFITQSSEAIWRFELDAPIPITLSPDEQIEYFYRHAYLAECNDAVARMYGYQSCGEITGMRLSDFLPETDAANTDYLRAFIESGYRLENAESHEVDRHGNPKFFLNNLVGVVEDGMILRAWGTQRDITEQKLIEQRVGESEERYRTVTETASDAIFQIDETSTILFVNHAAERIFGYKKNELIGQPLTVIMPEHLRERHLNGIKRYLATNIKKLSWESMEVPARHKDGRIFPLEISFGEFNEKGRRFFIGIARDISARKQSEKAGAYLAAIVESSDDAIISKDLQRRITSWNKGAERIFGYTAKEVIGKSITILIPPYLINEEDLILENIKKGKRIEHYETIRRRKDGTDIYVSITVSPIRDRSGKIIGASKIARDVSQSRETENELRESQAMLALTMRSSRMGAWSREIATNEVWWSDELEEIFGLPRGGFARTDNGFYDLIHEDDRQLINLEIEKAIAEKRDYIVEFRFHHADGSIRWMEGRGQAVYSDKGEPVRMYGIGIDITARKEAEGVSKRFQILSERARDIFFLLRPDGSILEANAAASRTYGYSRVEFLNLKIHDLREPATLETLENQLKKANLEGILFETLHRRKDGSTFPVEVNSTGAEIGGERLLLSVVRDITERKRAEEKIRESEERFRHIANAAPVMIWISDTTKKFVWFNKPWLDFTGRTMTQELGEGWTQGVHPEDVERSSETYFSSFDARKPFSMEYRLRRRDGEYRWVFDEGVPRLTPDGEFLGYIGSCIDITERKNSENRLALLAEISELARKVEDPKELLYVVSKAVGEHLNVKRCLFNEIDLENDLETIYRDYCRDTESVAGEHKVSDYSSVTSAEMQSGKIVVNSDSKTDPRTAADYEKSYAPNGERAYVAVPLMRENRWVASLWVSDDKPRQWSRQEVSLLETVAERVWSIVEKLRIDAELRESEERLRLALDAGRLGTWETDPNTKEIFWDARTRELFGVSPDEPLSYDEVVWKRIPPEDHETVREAVRKALDPHGAGVYDMQHRVRLKDGSIRWLHNVGKVTFEGEAENRRPTLMRGTVADITERKLSEQALSASEEKYRTLFDSIDEGFCIIEVIFDDSGKPFDYLFVQANPAFGRLTGLKNAVGRRVREFVPELEDFWFETYGRVALTGESVRFENESVPMKRWFDVFASRVGDSSSRRVAIIFNNITERKLSEEALRKSQAHLQLTTEAAQIGTWQWNLKTNELTWSPIHKKLWGYEPSPEPMDFELWSNLIDETDLKQAEEAIRRSLRGESDYDIEYRITPVGKTEMCWIRSSGRVDFNEAGEPVLMQGVSFDITERKRREANLAFLAGLAEDFSRLSSAEEIIQVVGEKISGYLKISNCLLSEIFESEDKVVVEEAWRDADSPELLGVYKLSDFVTGEFQRSARAGEILVIRNTQTDERTDAKAYAAYNIYSFVSVPFHQNSVWKYLFTVNSRITRDWREDEIDLIREVTNRIFPRLERARAEEAMRKSEAEFRTLANTVPQIVWVRDASGKILFVNKQWTEFSGLTLEETNRFETLAQILHPDDREKVTGAWAKAFADETPFEVEGRMRNSATGEYRWFLTRSEPTRDENGNAVQWFETSTDITFNKEVEMRLRETEERFSKAFKASPLVLAISSLKTGELIEVNETFINTTGYSREEVIGKTTLELGLWKNPEEREAEMEMVRRIGQLSNVEYTFKTRSGAEIIGLLAAERIEIGGEPFALTVIQDITERKQAEEKLRESEERFRNMADNAPVMVWVTDATGYCNYLSQSWYEFTGQTPETGLGYGWIKATHPDDQKLAEEAFLKSNEKHIPFRIEYRLLNKNGEYRWAIDSAQPRFGAKGEFLGYVGSVIDIHQRKEIEEKLATANYRFRVAEEAAKGINYEWNLETGAVTRSESVERVIGYERGELEPNWQAWMNLIHPDDRKDQTEAEAIEFISNLKDETFGGEYRLRHKDGHYIWLLERGIVIRDEHGKARRVIGQTVDITERKQIEEQIKYQLDLTETITNNTQMCLLMMDAEGRGTFANYATERVTGFKPEELIGEVLHYKIHHTHPDGTPFPIDECPLDRALPIQEAVIGYEDVFVHKDGHFYPVRCNGRPIYKDGKPVGTVIEVQDITEEKRLERERVETQKALIEAERRAAAEYLELLSRIVPLGQTLGTARDLISIYRSVGEFVRSSMPCSAFFVSFFDAEHSLRIAAYAWGEGEEVDIDTLPPMPITEGGGPNSRAILGKRIVVTNNNLMDAMRDRPHVVLQNNGIEPNSSIVVPMIVMNRVVGTLEVQAHEAEAYNREHTVALEMVANLAAVAIENVRLLQIEESARREAESANRAKDEFLSVVSHELRTPLNSMFGWTRMLKSGILDEAKQKQAVEVIERNVRLQNSLIEDLLDVSRIISGKMRIEKEENDFAVIVATAVEAARPNAEQRKISLVLETESASYPVQGDEVRLQQIVNNLINNAVKFTSEGGSVVLKLSRRNRMVVLDVTDSGIGIAPEFLPKIFDRFLQADSTTKRMHSGLGLGLTIVRHLTELHGGHVTASSEGLGKGATFTVELPLSQTFSAETGQDSNVSFKSENGSLKGSRILLVDDDADAMMPLQIILENHQAEVACASSAYEALEKLAAGKFDLIVSDIGMPEMDGYDMITLLRRSDQSPNREIPAIALTAYASAQDKARALKSGFQQHFAKPIDFDNFLASVKNFIRETNKK